MASHFFVVYSLPARPTDIPFGSRGHIPLTYSLIPGTSAASARGVFWKALNLKLLQAQVRKEKLKYLKILSQEGRSVPTVHGPKTHYGDQCFLNHAGDLQCVSGTTYLLLMLRSFVVGCLT